MERIYLYNPKTKEEILGTSDVFDNEKYDIGYIARVEKRIPLGAFLSDLISVDFERIRGLLQSSDIVGLYKELGVALDCFKAPCDSLDEITYVANEVFLLKEFIDICNEYPQFYSFDFFYKFLDVSGLGDEIDLPEELGDYADIGDLMFDKFPVGHNYSFPKYDEEIDFYTIDFSHNKMALRSRLLGPDPYLAGLENHTEVFRVSSSLQIAVTSLLTIIGERYVVKKCSLCGKYFVPLNRSDTLYCDRPSPNDPCKSCKEYASQKLWYDRLKSDEVAKLARNIYSSKQMLVRRNPDIVGYRKMFDYFKMERKKWETLVKSGKKSKEEYISWLNEMKAKKTL